MTYATQTDLESAFTVTEISQLISGGRDVDAALRSADSTIDSYAAVRFSVPFAAPVPQQVIDVACDLARFAMYAGAADQEVRDRRDDAIAWLRDLAAGRAQLPGVAQVAEEGSAIKGQSPARSGKLGSVLDCSGY